MGRPKGSKNKPKQTTLIAKVVLNTANPKLHISSGTTSFLGVFDSFSDIPVTPAENNTVIVDFEEYIYSNSNWNKINYVGTYNTETYPAEPLDYDVVGIVPSIIEYPFEIAYKIYKNGSWSDFTDFKLTLNVKEIND